MDNLENASKIFREERKKRNISQKEMAQLLGVERSTYSAYENGTRRPSLPLLQKFSELSGISLDTLVQGGEVLHIPKELEPLIRKLVDADAETVKQVEIFLDFWDSREKGFQKKQGTTES